MTAIPVCNVPASLLDNSVNLVSGGSTTTITSTINSTPSNTHSRSMEFASRLAAEMGHRRLFLQLVRGCSLCGKPTTFFNVLLRRRVCEICFHTQDEVRMCSEQYARHRFAMPPQAFAALPALILPAHVAGLTAQPAARRVLQFHANQNDNNDGNAIAVVHHNDDNNGDDIIVMNSQERQAGREDDGGSDDDSSDGSDLEAENGPRVPEGRALPVLPQRRGHAQIRPRPLHPQQVQADAVPATARLVLLEQARRQARRLCGGSIQLTQHIARTRFLARNTRWEVFDSATEQEQHQQQPPPLSNPAGSGAAGKRQTSSAQPPSPAGSPLPWLPATVEVMLVASERNYVGTNQRNGLMRPTAANGMVEWVPTVGMFPGVAGAPVVCSEAELRKQLARQQGLPAGTPLTLVVGASFKLQSQVCVHHPLRLVGACLSPETMAASAAGRAAGRATGRATACSGLKRHRSEAATGGSAVAPVTAAPPAPARPRRGEMPSTAPGTALLSRSVEDASGLAARPTISMGRVVEPLFITFAPVVFEHLNLRGCEWRPTASARAVAEPSNSASKGKGQGKGQGRGRDSGSLVENNPNASNVDPNSGSGGSNPADEDEDEDDEDEDEAAEAAAAAAAAVEEPGPLAGQRAMPYMCGLDIRSQAVVTECSVTSSGSAILVQAGGVVAVRRCVLRRSGCAALCFVEGSRLLAVVGNVIADNATWGVQRSNVDSPAVLTYPFEALNSIARNRLGPLGG